MIKILAIILSVGVINVRPAANPEGKLLTMEEANISSKVYPQSARPKMPQQEKSIFGQENGSVYMLVTSSTAAPATSTQTASPATSPQTASPASSQDTLWIAKSEGAISYGTSVSRNEFGIRGGMFPSPDGTKLAFYRKDESKVTEFPLLDITTRTGSLNAIRYPMNGMASERVDLCVYDSKTGKTITLDVDSTAETCCNINGDCQEKSQCTPHSDCQENSQCTARSNNQENSLFGTYRYLAAISWQGENTILMQVIDRSQHHSKLVAFDACTGKLTATLQREDNEAWVEPYDTQIQLTENLFIYSTDNRDGYKNMYLCDMQGGIRRIPTALADVNFVSFQNGWIYYTSAEVSPAENHLFRISITNLTALEKTASQTRQHNSQANKANQNSQANKAKFSSPQQLTKEHGWHSITMLENGWADRFSSFDNPGWTKTFTLDGKLKETLIVSEDPLKDYAACEVEFGTVPSADGLYENHYRLIKPLNFDPQKKYPLIVYVYGGPHSQMVHDSWLGNIRMWEMLMAQRGYVIYCQDNRGTQNHGAAYEKAISRQCGQAEMADQMVGISALLEKPWIDSSRVGVHGWSYGGFMTISLATTYPEVFKVAVAGGPVIDWKWYEIMYGERYMDTAATNPEGFEKVSLMGKADKLQCKLLICQGAIDDTVVWEHSLSFLQECITAQKQVDYFPFPKAYHNMRGRERVYLYQKITDYFDNNL